MSLAPEVHPRQSPTEVAAKKEKMKFDRTIIPAQTQEFSEKLNKLEKKKKKM